MSIFEFLKPEGWLNEAAGPRYVQLRRRLEEGIKTGLLAPDTPLPPEREIAEITDLSRVTVRKAIHQLVQDGAIEARQGSGSFVRQPSPRFEQSLTLLTSFTEDMRRHGLETTSKWLERGIFLPNPDEVSTLELNEDDQVSRIFRLREAGGRPVALERATLPLDILPNPIDVSSSLYAHLRQTGNHPVRALEKISAVNLKAGEARLLGVEESDAGLSIRRVAFLDTGRPIELTQSFYRGDAYDFIAELRLSN